MSLLDRIFGRTVENSYHLSVESPAPPPKPHNFCSKCGQPMVDGYMVIGHEFDTMTGAPAKRVARGRMCIALHGKDRPEYSAEIDGYPGESDHDGFPGYAWWSSSDPDLIPDCEPRKGVAA